MKRYVNVLLSYEPTESRPEDDSLDSISKDLESEISCCYHFFEIENVEILDGNEPHRRKPVARSAKKDARRASGERPTVRYLLYSEEFELKLLEGETHFHDLSSLEVFDRVVFCPEWICRRFNVKVLASFEDPDECVDFYNSIREKSEYSAFTKCSLHEGREMLSGRVLHIDRVQLLTDSEVKDGSHKFMYYYAEGFQGTHGLADHS